jgi:hypothetical protein
MVTIKQSTKFLAKYKNHFGYADWSIIVQPCKQPKDDEIAEAEYDYWDKQLTITLFPEYFKRKDWQATLIHELVHARIGIAQDLFSYASRKLHYTFEEQAINDITAGIMSLLEEQEE